MSHGLDTYCTPYNVNKNIVFKNKEFVMNTQFSYMYRDSANYKSFYEFVFEGEISDAQILRFVKLCDDEYFIPRAIGLPGGVFEGEDGYDAELDHYWCEHDFEASFQRVNNKPNVVVVDGNSAVVKIDTFLDVFEKCCGRWEDALSKPIRLSSLATNPQNISLSELIQTAEKETDLHSETIKVSLTKDEIALVKQSLDMMGDRLADKEGYSSGEKCWDLKQKLEAFEKECSLSVER